MSVRHRWSLLVAAALGTLGAAVLATAPPGVASGSMASSALRDGNQSHPVGLGKVLTTRDGGQIFGWDIDQHGNDGVLASSQDTGEPGVYKVSVETFDQTTGRIVSSFARSTNARDSYGVDGIFADDIGLVTHYVVPKGSIFAKRRYDLMDPVTANMFTGPWQPPIRDVDVLANAENQDTTTSVVFTIELKHLDVPDLVVGDLAAGTSHVIHLDPDLFGLADAPQLAQDTVTNRAVIAFSPDGGAVGGLAPRNAIVNLDTGRVTIWSGINGGPLGAGYVNGLAVDSSTGMAATTTELNAQVEFYNLKRRSGVAVQLPGTGPTDQLNSGAAVAVDEANHLFLVADPDYAPSGDSAVVVYDEHGNLLEAITGFSFSNGSRVVPVRVAVNPASRTGWVDGPGVDQLQQFFY